MFDTQNVASTSNSANSFKGFNFSVSTPVDYSPADLEAAAANCKRRAEALLRGKSAHALARSAPQLSS